MKTALFSILFATALSFGAALCAEEAKPAPAKYSEADYKLCYDIFDELNLRKNNEKTLTLMVDIQTRNMPHLVPFKGVMQAFFQKYASFDVLKKDYANIYLSEFSVEELKMLLAFYRTPFGKKLSAAQPSLMAKCAKLGEENVRAHMKELQEMVRARAEELKKAQQATPAAK